MNIGQFIAQATAKLAATGIDSARLDVLLLLEDAFERDRSHLLAHPEMPLSPAHLHSLNTKIVHRTTHLPLAYIRGRSDFFGRNFAVNTSVLVPRPESEAMIEILLQLPQLPTHPRIADVGTGSGCLGITAALELPGSIVDMYDIDPRALAVARQNAKRLQAKVQLHHHNLLENVKIQYSVVLANLPYVPTEHPINTAATHEPPHALFAGKDGLDLYRTFWQQLASMKHSPQHVITESLRPQHVHLTALATQAGYRLQAVDGLAQSFARQM